MSTDRPADTPPGTTRVRSARIELDEHGQPHAPDYGDRYHAAIGPAAQAREVFLAGNQLPARWAGRRHFVVLETGMGLGNNFLATWQAWRDDPRRCDRLHYVSIDAHPPSGADMRRCHATSPWPDLARALYEAWPAPVAGLHRFALDGDHVQLVLAFGEVVAMLRALDLQADAVYLDGFAPARNPAMWRPEVFKALSRLVAPAATAATWSVAGAVRDGLRNAGFESHKASGPGAKREVTRACRHPRHEARQEARHLRRPRGRAGPVAPDTAGPVAVIGAGLAGAWAAWALARNGRRVHVFERQGRVATLASGNPAGIFHPTVHGDDSVHAALLRAAADEAVRSMGPWIRGGAVPGALNGLLRVARSGEDPQALRQRWVDLALPEDQLALLDPDAASQAAGVRIDRPAWRFGQAGWVAPQALVKHLLADAGVELHTATGVASLRRLEQGWQLVGDDGRHLLQASAVVLANAGEVESLWPHGSWPLGQSRGQLSWWPTPPAGSAGPVMPLAGDGYALTLPDGALVFGATASPEGDATPDAADHLFNLQRLARLTGLRAEAGTPWRSRVGWRSVSADRLPMVGPVPCASTPARQATRLQDTAREPGLYVLGALGGRGLTLAPLLARMLAAWVDGTPMPVPVRLRDAVDPARWRVRQARRSGHATGGRA